MIKRAIILSAGQGSRLLPLTESLPKCLIAFSGKTLLEWQVNALVAGGVERIDVVTGFMTEKVEAELARLARPGVMLTALFNPFYKDFLILNGDTLISDAIVARVLAESDWPVRVTVDIKLTYDSDDMKVERDGERLIAIGKTLSVAQSNAESIGFLAFRGEGATLFRDAVEAFMRTPAGVENWYLKVIDALAPTGKIGTCAIDGLDWAEVDFLNDVQTAENLTRGWA
jgi:L-glutamine-phosphate cytidylyltransferase